MRKWFALLCALVMLASSTAFAQETAQDALLDALDADAQFRFSVGADEMNIYRNLDTAADFSDLPAAYDLRAQGFVPPVRSQGSWGTCWGFSIIAASEISILSEVGMTVDEYEQASGAPMDLSEKHLAWFANGALPAAENYPEGEYIFGELITQAGEGTHNMNEETEGLNVRYNNGGYMAFGSGLFSAGMGPVTEADFPYQAADGTDNQLGDWTLPEESRFHQGAELENSNILPSPALKDEDGYYFYNPAGTYAIKSELLAGRGVSIAYHADQAMDPDAQAKRVQSEMEEVGITVELDDARAYVALTQGEIGIEDMTDQQIKTAIVIIFALYTDTPAEELGEVNSDVTREECEEHLASLLNIIYPPEPEMTEEEIAEMQLKAEEEEAASRAMAAQLGIDFDGMNAYYAAVGEADARHYITADTHAQYTDNELAPVNHAVTIIGWDDNYPAENFLEGQQPPADGAWIVRNSWGADYAHGGYFYLSYYDKTITAPETFDFVTSYNSGAPGQLSLSAWDFMPVSYYSSVHMNDTIQYANMFTMGDEETVVKFLSVLTADLNVEVTADVYLLDEDAVSPDDGVLLDRVVKSFTYGGYHRMALNHDFMLPANARIGVVVTQRIRDNGETTYLLPYTATSNKAQLDALNVVFPSMNGQVYYEGCIGEGESFVKMDNAWTDWVDVIDMHRQNSNAGNYLDYDNLSIKLYTYSLADLLQMHEFNQSVVFNGVTMHQCDDCSYSFVQQ